jgi:hypothetical protein
LQEYQRRFVGLKSKWTQPFLEVDSSYAITVKDLKALFQRNQSLKTLLKLTDEEFKQAQTV